MKVILSSIGGSLVLAFATSAATFVSGLVPDWNQPNWHGQNQTIGNPMNGGPVPPDPAWDAWCVPTSVANVLGHWNDARGLSGISDGAAYPFSAVLWGVGPSYQDYQANGAATRGFVSPGAADDLGWYMDTNRRGDSVHGNMAPHVGTRLGNISPGGLGLNKFFVDQGLSGFSAYTRGLSYADPQTTRLPNVAAAFAELVGEVNANRTAVAHFTHWNIVLQQAGGLPPGLPTTESNFGFDYYTFGSFTPVGPEFGEQWNQDDLGHAVTVVGYIPANAPDDILGNTDWVIVHDNWGGSVRNLAVPMGSEWMANTVIVPEPSTYALVLLGLGMLGVGRLVVKRRSRQRPPAAQG